MPYKDIQKRKEYQKEYQIRNKKRIRIVAKRWIEKNRNKIRARYHDNKERYSDYYIKYYLKHRREILARVKKYRDGHKKEIYFLCKLWATKNAEKVRLSRKKWYEKHKEKWTIYAIERRARKANAVGKHTTQEWEELKKKWNYYCIECGKQEPFLDQVFQNLTEDHIVPLKRGGSNFIENIQPMCHRCNAKKGGR